MRRTILALTALAAVSVGAQPASAAPLSTDRAEWEPAPSAPWDVAAGVRCDFAVHGEPIVDEVVRRVLARHPDGSPKQVAYEGDIVVRVTNTASGDSYDADASGSALVDYRADGSQFWSVRGPVLVGVGEGRGNLPRPSHRGRRLHHGHRRRRIQEREHGARFAHRHLRADRLRRRGWAPGSATGRSRVVISRPMLIKRDGRLLQELRLHSAEPKPHPYVIRYRDAADRRREEAEDATL